MGVSQIDLISKYLREEIALAKSIRSPLFEEEDLDRYDKQIVSVSSKMLKVVKKINLNSFFLVKLFVKASFPTNGRHFAINALEYAWKTFKESKFDDDCLSYGQYITGSEVLRQVDADLRVFFSTWNKIAKSTKEAHKQNPNAQPYFLDKAYIGNFYAYKAALGVYFFTRPIILANSKLGDIILDEFALRKFLLIGYETNYFFASNIALPFLSKKTFDETQYSIIDMLNKYNDKFQNDKTLKAKKLRAVSGKKFIKRDEEAIKKI